MKNRTIFRASIGAIALLTAFLAGCGGSGNSSSTSSSSTTSTTTTLAASSTSTTVGTSITLTATVSPTAATGTVTFYSGSTSLGTGTLSSGTATLTTSFSSTGTYSITAVYAGSSTYATSTSSAVSITVSSSTTSTATALAASSTAVTTGTSVTLTATVSPSAATGTVTFYSGSTSLGTGTLSSGTATLTTTFSSAGTYTLTATYGGSSSYASSTSSSVSITVTTSSSTSSGTATTTTLSVSPSSTAYVNATVVLTATVASSSATGTVAFYDTAGELGTATLSSGTASYATSFSSTGTYSLYAIYEGDSTYATSTSSTVSETISSSSYSLSLSSYSETCSQSMTATTYSSASDTTGTSHTITYCLYKNVIYAANPDNYQYESMNIFVPTAVDGTSVTVSTSSTPILLDNCIGGYLGCTVYGNTSVNSTNGQYFLANGYVVVEVGARGRDVADSSGVYGSAPAAIVDLKAAVRFIRHNSGTFPGDVDKIISNGGSAGGALSTLVGASGNSTLYNSYLATIGAANADDNVFAVIAYSPITNLDHADMCYEWEYGTATYSGTSSEVNQTVSGELQTLFETYQDNLGLTASYHTSAHSTSTYPYGSGTYSSLTYSNIDAYILNDYLIPSVEMYLASLSSTARTSYLSSNTWITYTSSSGAASFTFADYVSAIGRGKSVPAFDSFYGDSSISDSSLNTTETGEINEFGDGSSSTAYAHFTNFSSEYTGGSAISTSQQTRANMMNPMYFITNGISGSSTSGIANYWYIRDGSIATDTSAIVIIDLSTSLEDLLGANTSSWSVNAWENWGQGHNVDADPWDMMTWVKSII